MRTDGGGGPEKATAPRPTISAVIPTHRRPELVARAVRSALAQTFTDLEVIVVVDGADPQTLETLAGITDPRLRVVALEENQGACAARNAGITAACGTWVALLDDDDEWRPEKLALQFAAAGEPTPTGPIVGCRSLVCTPRTVRVLPRRAPRPGEPLSEYLFRRRGPFHGDGWLPTSALLAPRALFERVPFTPGLRRLQETDWLLRATSGEGAGAHLVVAMEPLVIWHDDTGRPRITADDAWAETLAWFRGNRELFTERAYGAAILSVVASMAAPSHDTQVFGTLLAEARRHGRPGWRDYLTFVAVWLMPRPLRRAVRDALGGDRQPWRRHAPRTGHLPLGNDAVLPPAPRKEPDAAGAGRQPQPADRTANAPAARPPRIAASKECRGESPPLQSTNRNH